MFLSLISSRGCFGGLASSNSTVEAISTVFLVDDLFPVEGGSYDFMGEVIGSRVCFLLLKIREIGPTFGVDPKEIMLGSIIFGS